MLRAGVAVDATDKHGKTALMHAAEIGHLEIIETLIGAKCNIDVQDEWKRTPLMGAVRSGRTAAARRLIEANAALDVQDDKGKNALMFAAKKGDIETLEYLVAAKARLDDQDNDGESALTHAKTAGQAAIVQALLREGAVPTGGWSDDDDDVYVFASTIERARPECSCWRFCATRLRWRHDQISFLRLDLPPASPSSVSSVSSASPTSSHTTQENSDERHMREDTSISSRCWRHRMTSNRHRESSTMEPMSPSPSQRISVAKISRPRPWHAPHDMQL